MTKVLDLTRTVYDLCEEYPEVKDIMKDIGFKDITSPTALKFMGKMMTIPKGAMVKNISMEVIIKAFEEAGFQVLTPEMKQAAGVHDDVDPRIEKLKTLIKRVGNGEDIETVRADFVRDFESVSVHDIVGAEQSLIREGMPTQEVMKLCDLHSALFHGRTEAEIWAEEERAAAEEKKGADAGHPEKIFRLENSALEKLILVTETALDQNDFTTVKESLRELKKIRLLYSKKEGLLMPILNRYGVTGPSEVMWGVDDEIKKDISRIASVFEGNEEAEREALKKVLARMKEMIYKEENILLPAAIKHFSESEWVDVYQDIDEMGCIYVDTYPKWEHGEEVLAERRAQKEADLADGIVRFDAGEMSVAHLQAMMKLLPIDITFIDENDINRFYANEGKFFSRPLSSLGRPVYDCHPERVKPIVKEIIRSFKAGEKDTVERWIPNPMNPVKITYLAVRSAAGLYLGTLELVQEFGAYKEELMRIWNHD